MIEDDALICPICGIKVKNLISHIRRSHDNSIKNRIDFENRFPELKGCKLQITVFDTSKEFICPVCRKIYHRKNDLQNHIKNKHPDIYVKTSNPSSLPKIKCPICGKEVGNLKQHVRETHELEWMNFCQTYNWDVKLSKIITDEYRKKLSKNKKEYYRSERGLKRRQLQSQMWKDNNPIHDPEKLSKAIYNRTHNGNLKVATQDMRGIKVQCFGRTFRSFCEFEFYIICKMNNMIVSYEPCDYCIKWLNKERNFYSTYLPDFYIEGIGLIELKHTKKTVISSKNEEKYKTAEQIYNNLNIDYQITSIDMFCDKYNIKYNFETRQYIKQYIKQLANEGKIQFITPYRHARKLRNLFEVDDLSTIKCIKFTKKSGHNLYGEL